MTRYLKKVIPVIVFLFAITLINYFDIFNSLESNVRIIANQGKLADSCVSGEGTTYYINSYVGAEVKNGAGATYTTLSTLPKCTVVKVYCTSGSWGRISKTSEKWIMLDRATTNRPSSCSAISNTTTDTISYTVESIKTIPATDYDQMYLDRNGKIEIRIKNIKNVAIDEKDLFNIKVTKGSTDVTNDFIIEKNFTGTYMTVTLKMNGAENGTKYSAGAYNVTITAGKVTAKKSFSLVGKYYNFTGSFKKISGPTGNPNNKLNTWLISINNRVNIDMTKFNYVIKNSNGVDCTYNFSMERDGAEYTLKNKTFWGFMPLSGTYTVIFTYSNPTVSNSRGSLTYQFDLEIGVRDITFSRESIESHRYVRTKDNVPYTIQLIKKRTSNSVTYIDYIENSETKSMSETEFTSTYVDIDLSKIMFTSAGNIAYRHNELCTVINFKNGVFTYTDDAGTKTTENEATFKTNYPEAYEIVMSDDYSFGSDGSLYMNISGVKVVDGKRLSPKNQNVFAGVGGEFDMVYNYADLCNEDFTESTYKIFREDGSTVSEKDGFYFSWTYDAKNAYINIKYDNQDAEKYTGNYYVRIYFKDAAHKDIPFVLYDGDVDFYLTSQVDDHASTLKPLETTYPPGNQRFEYYLGFYLIKGGKVQTTKNAKMIDVKIFDHFVDLDENGNMYYYNQVDYVIQIKKYIDDKVTFDITENNTTTTKTLTFSEFEKKYANAAELINNYTYDAEGNLLADNYELEITRFYNDESIADMRVVYKDAAGKSYNQPLNDFKVAYPDMYGYLVTRFNFDTDGNIILGAISGAYRVTSENGTLIEGNDVTNQFNIQIDNSSTNIEKAVTILPKTEVDAGTYYVYASYDSLQGIGFVNDAEDAVITKELFPEMWKQNIHMTMITYEEPIYSLEIAEPKLSNVGNNNDKIYNNIEGTAHFDITPEFIYDFSGISYGVEYYDGSSWVNANTHFNGINSFDSESEEYNTNNPYIELISNVGVAKTGKYRLVVNYTNKGQSCKAIKEFEVSGKYYGLVIDKSETIKYIHNYTAQKTFYAKGYYIDNANNIVPEITRLITSDTKEELIHDKTNKQFKNSSGDVVFKYNYQINEDYYDEDNTLLYQFNLSNVGNVTNIGNYELTLNYSESNGDISTSNTKFFVGDDEYFIDIKNEYPKANEDEMSITMDIETKYIIYDDLDVIDYIVYYYDKNEKKYIDVSSPTSSNRMFIINDIWDSATAPDYKGNVVLNINKERADMDGHYYLYAKFRNIELEFPMSSLNDLFAWNVDKYSIEGIYHEKITDEDGNVVDSQIKVNRFYSNIYDTTINVLITSAHEDNIKWRINKDCLNDTCDPTAGTSYNDRFIATNTTGTNKQLSLKLREDLTSDEELEPGTYALTLYYSKTDYKVLRLVVFSEFVQITFGDALIYSDITTDKVINGLFNNKDGHIHVPVLVNGVSYEDVTVNITDANGTKNYNTSFIYDRNKFNEEHILDIKYPKTINLDKNKYLITVSYETAEEVVSDTLNFDMNSAYYNYYINDPTYSPNPLIPNAEDGGIASFEIVTEDIPNVLMGNNGLESSANMHVFAKNAVIKDAEGNDVTNQFNITSTIIQGKYSSFNLNVAYEKNAIKPGYYQISTTYEIDGYIIKRDSSFMVEDYVKSLNVGKVEVITNTNDGKMHKNISGIYRVYYSSEYELNYSSIKVAVKNSENEDVTERFNIDVYEKYIDIKYNANEPYLNSGDYQIIITYVDESTKNEDINTVDVKMYATYKDINISNMEASASTIYADRDNQYFTFKVDTNVLTSDDIQNLKAQIFDSYGNIVYSDIDEKIVDKFTVINNLNTSDANYRINVLPFKANVGEYTIKLYLMDEDGEYNSSNALTLKINKTYYKVALSTDSTIEQIKNYNSDTTNIYDKDGAKGNYKFTSTYPSTNYSEYSIQILENGINIKEIDIDVEKVYEDGLSLLVTDFITDALLPGKYDIALCLNGLPYAYKTINVIEYVKATKVTMIIDGKEIKNNHLMYYGQNKKVSFKYEPSNATDINFIYSSNDTNIAEFKNGNIIINGVGSTTITLKNSDILENVTLTTEQRLTSDIYNIDYDKSIVYIKNMKAKKLEKTVFVKNLIGLVKEYKILNSNNNDITSTTTVVGTGMSIVNGTEKYKVVLIGDINGDGLINVFDNSMLFQHVRGKNRIKDEYKLMAADIRKQNNISIFDVSKLFQFIRNKISSI